MALNCCVTLEDSSQMCGPEIVDMVELAFQGFARQINELRPKIDALLPWGSCLSDAFEHTDRVGIFALAFDVAYLTQLCFESLTSELALNTQVALAALEICREALSACQSGWPQVESVLAVFVPTTSLMDALQLCQREPPKLRDAKHLVEGLRMFTKILPGEFFASGAAGDAKAFLGF